MTLAHPVNCSICLSLEEYRPATLTVSSLSTLLPVAAGIPLHPSPTAALPIASTNSPLTASLARLFLHKYPMNKSGLFPSVWCLSQVRRSTNQRLPAPISKNKKPSKVLKTPLSRRISMTQGRPSDNRLYDALVNMANQKTPLKQTC